jgi:hypothetical protein
MTKVGPMASQLDMVIILISHITKCKFSYIALKWFNEKMAIALKHD